MERSNRRLNLTVSGLRGNVYAAVGAAPSPRNSLGRGPFGARRASHRGSFQSKPKPAAGRAHLSQSPSWERRPRRERALVEAHSARGAPPTGGLPIQAKACRRAGSPQPKSFVGAAPSPRKGVAIRRQARLPQGVFLIQAKACRRAGSPQPKLRAVPQARFGARRASHRGSSNPSQSLPQGAHLSQSPSWERRPRRERA